jgi:hypothetical protein
MVGKCTLPEGEARQRGYGLRDCVGGGWRIFLDKVESDLCGLKG